MWRAWNIDAFTIAWAAWLTVLVVGFIVIETAALKSAYVHTLTAHLRPVFTWQPVIWWLLNGAFAWGWLHLMLPPAEHALADLVQRGLP